MSRGLQTKRATGGTGIRIRLGSLRRVRVTGRTVRSFLIVLALSVLLMAAPALSIVVALTAVNLIIKDHFPFSHFPMYTSFGRETYYLYITDQNDDVVPVQHFRMSSTALKKIYRAQVLQEHPGAKVEHLPPEALQRAGEYALDYLHHRPRRKSLPATFETLRLYQVHLWVEEGDVRKSTRLIAEG